MKQSRSTLRFVLGGAVAGGVGLVQAASGQDGLGEPTGLRVVLDYSLGIDVDSNYDFDEESPGTYYALVNGFEFALLSNTRNQQFALTFGSQLRLQQDPGSDDSPLEWTYPNFLVRYARESSRSRFTVSSDLLVRDVDTVEPFFLDVDGDTIIDQAGFDASEGTLTQFGFDASLVTGIDAPIGTTYTAAYSSRTYADTDDPDLYDRIDYRVGTLTRFRFSPVTTGTLRLSAREYEYSSGRDLLGQNYSYSFGLIHEFSPTVVGEASLGYAKTREEEDIDGVTEFVRNDGGIGSVGLTRELRNGTIFGEYDRSLLEDTFRNRLNFGRTISTPVYDLDARVGATNLDGGEVYPTFGITLTRELPDGQLSASVRRTVTLDTDDNESILTSAFLAYSREINAVSSFNLGFDYALVSDIDTDDPDDETRATFVASYQHALTEDWAMNVGYRGRVRNSDSEDAVSNAVFIDIGRRFIFR